MPKISLEELENGILINKFDLFTIDTNMFIAPDFKFHTGKLQSISNLEGYIKFALQDVVLKESLKHYKKFISANINESIRNLKKIDFFNEVRECINFLEEKQKNIEKLHNSIFNTFIVKSRAIKIENDIDINKIMDSYFTLTPPFSENKTSDRSPDDDTNFDRAKTKNKKEMKRHGKKDDKKHEFPDAIALHSIESFAKKTLKKIIVISNDTGWKNYCTTSENLYAIDDHKDVLYNALFIFKKHQDKIALENTIKNFLINEEFTNHDSLIKNLLTDFIDDTSNIECDGISRHYFEIENYENKLTNIIYTDAIIRIDDIYNNTIHASALIPIQFTCYTNVELTYYDSIDKEYDTIDTQDIDIDIDTEIEFNFTIIQNKNGEITADSLKESEIVSGTIPVNLGEFEPNYWGDDCSPSLDD